MFKRTRLAALFLVTINGTLLSAPPTRPSTLQSTPFAVIDCQPKDWVGNNSDDSRAKEINEKIASQPQTIWGSKDAFSRINEAIEKSDGKIVTVNAGEVKPGNGEYREYCRELKEHIAGKKVWSVLGMHALSSTWDSSDVDAKKTLNEISDSVQILKDKVGKRGPDLTTWADLSKTANVTKLVNRAKMAGIADADFYTLNLGKDDEYDVAKKQAELIGKALKKAGINKPCVISTTNAGKKVNGKPTLGPKPAMVVNDPFVSANFYGTVAGENEKGEFDPDTAMFAITGKEPVNK